MADNLPALTLAGVVIEMTGEKDWEMLSLNGIYKAAGSPPNKDPRQWLRLSSTEEAIDFQAKLLDVEKSHIVKTERGGAGGGGSSMAYWVIAIKYAGYLSVACENDVIRAWRKYKELTLGQPRPTLEAVPPGGDLVTLQSALVQLANIQTCLTQTQIRMNERVDDHKAVLEEVLASTEATTLELDARVSRLELAYKPDVKPQSNSEFPPGDPVRPLSYRELADKLMKRWVKKCDWNSDQIAGRWRRLYDELNGRAKINVHIRWCNEEARVRAGQKKRWGSKLEMLEAIEKEVKQPLCKMLYSIICSFLPPAALGEESAPISG